MEFVSHITRSFALSILPTKVERAKEATANMGSAVSTIEIKDTSVELEAIFTHCHVISNLYDLLSSAQNKRIYYEEGW